jgi:TatD DNase family protein
MITDTHSHLNFKAYDADRDEVIKRAQKEGVVCIDVGVNYKTSKSAVDLAKKYENIFSVIGVHPSEIGEEFDAEKYKELAKSKRVVAIGEIGLDYKFKNEGQREIFIKQLNLAAELDLPVIVHCRMAFGDLYEIFKNYQLQTTHYKLAGVIHCFTGNWEEAQKYLALGFYLGINGIIDKLPARPAGGDLTEVIKNCPLDKILTETDCPYLTPKAEGEKRNEPIFVKHVIQKIADIKEISFDEVASATFQNAKKLFKI